jgi:hypothetical protein
MGEIQEFLRRSSRKPAQREDDEGDLERSVVELTQSLRKGEVDTHSSNSSVSSIDEDSQGNEGRSRVTEDVDAFEDAIRREFVLQSPTPLTDHVSLHRGIVEGVDDLELEEELEEDDAQSTVEVTEARRGSGLGSNNSNLDPDYLRESCSDALDDTRRLRRIGAMRSDFHLRPARPPKPRWKDCCRLKFGI